MKLFLINMLLIASVIFTVANDCSAQDSISNQKDVNIETKFKLTEFINLRDSLFTFNFRSLPKSALNSKRFSIVSDHNEGYRAQTELNKGIQQYFDNTFVSFTKINNQYNVLLNDLKTNKSEVSNEQLLEYINTLQKEKILHSIWRANLVHVKNEQEMISNIKNTTQEMMNEGYDNLSQDLLPLITMLMLEQHIDHYDTYRAISTKPSAKGIVNSVQILNTLSSLDKKDEIGVCRDVHDMGLRILRPMYQVYLNEKYPNNNYNVDDYIFLHAWVTPSSQHVTLTVIDPENTRNYQELDWGRIYKKENQEGIEIGKMVGTTIRLWQYNPKKDVTGPINLLKSQWGLFLDNNLLKQDENWLINGIYNPQYSTSANYIFKAGKNSETSVSIGMLNANEKSLSFNYRSGSHKTQITKFLQYSGVVGFQDMIIDDTQRKSLTMPWTEWHSVVNMLASLRYLSTLKTTPLKIMPHLKANLYALSQIEFTTSMTYFKSESEDFDNHLHSTGDGNVWLAWGAELKYNKPKFEFDLKYGSRNFLIPTDIRLLSPNPFELIRHATVANSGSGILFRAKYKANKWYFEPEFRYEQNKMNASFMLYSLKTSKKLDNKNQLFVQAGSFNQIEGMEYYWYAKSRFWFNAGFESYKKQFNISLYSEIIKNDFPTFGISFNKYL